MRAVARSRLVNRVFVRPSTESCGHGPALLCPSHNPMPLAPASLSAVQLILDNPSRELLAVRERVANAVNVFGMEVRCARPVRVRPGGCVYDTAEKRLAGIYLSRPYFEAP